MNLSGLRLRVQFGSVRLVALIAVFIHELLVGPGEVLKSFVHRGFGGEERGAEVQGVVLLSEPASRHKHDTRLVQDLFVMWATFIMGKGCQGQEYNTIHGRSRTAPELRMDTVLQNSYC